MADIDISLALTGAIPALLAMAYFDRLDAKRPEPRSTLRRVALAGALSTLPCIAGAYVLLGWAPAAESYARALYDAFIVAAGLEELAKLLVVYWFVWHRPEFDERLDGIVYAARAGLGFALVENVLYLLGTNSASDFALTYLLRALLAVPGHAIWAGIMGYYAARRRFDNIGPGIVGGYLIAVAMHGTYDAVVFAGPLLRDAGHEFAADALLALVPAIVVGGGMALRRLAHRALVADDRAAAAAHLSRWYFGQALPNRVMPDRVMPDRIMPDRDADQQNR